MTVAVAHNASHLSQDVLAEAVREAGMRGTSLVLIHAVDAIDADVEAALKVAVEDDIAAVVAQRGLPPVSWALVPAPGNDVAEAVLTACEKAGAEVLVIGARKRSPVGKALMGSVAQTLILEASLPVLVVKKA